MASDNLSGTNTNGFKGLYLLPAKILLWLFYMAPGKSLAHQSFTGRIARSPIVTGLIATAFWLFVLLMLLVNTEFGLQLLETL